MNSQNVNKHFESMGSRLKVRRQAARVRRSVQDTDFSIDIAMDDRGEYFDLLLRDGGEDVDFTVLDVRPGDRHLLLMATLAPPSPGRRARPSRFLCGHDERHWFVAGVPSGSTVEEAKEALKPNPVRESQVRHRVRTKHRNLRKNAGFLRQGEWFFVPAPDLDPDSWLVLRNEPLRRGAGKPHLVELLYRRGGTLVYVCHQHPNGLTEREYTKLIREKPAAKKLPWRNMMRQPAVYAKGKIRHEDHKTIVLPFWHQVLLSNETLTSNVAFLD